MITVYTISGNSSCRAAITWFEENNIHYRERKAAKKSPLTEIEIVNMLRISEGTHQIVSERSYLYKNLKNIDGMKLRSELIPFICENPRMLTFPIIVNGLDLQVGFDHEEYKKYIPKKVRKLKFNNLIRNVG